MTVIEKLEKNIDQVNSDIQAIKSKIVSHGVEVADGTRPAEYPPKIDEVYEAGKKSEHDAFWDNYQNYGNRDSYTYSFRLWNDTMFKPKYDIKPNGQYGADQMFYQTEIVDIVGCLEKQGVSIDFSNATRLSSTFDRTTTATTVPPIDATSCASMSLTFYSSQKVKSIEIYNLKEECTFDRVFHYAYGLESLTIEGTIGQNGFDVQSSAKLSKASITSIINALSSTTSGKTVTLSKTAVNKAFETSQGLANGSTSEEWLNLIATKNNWTISLV